MSQFYIEVQPMWTIIQDIKEQIRTTMAGKSESLIDFTIIVASELIENAIKYGISNQSTNHVGIEFKADDEKILVKVMNGIISQSDMSEFIRIMEKIKANENKELLYIERLQEIMENPDAKGSQLGLFRIASETKFEIDYKIENNMLKVFAERKLK